MRENGIRKERYRVWERVWERVKIFPPERAPKVCNFERHSEVVVVTNKNCLITFPGMDRITRRRCPRSQPASVTIPEIRAGVQSAQPKIQDAQLKTRRLKRVGLKVF